MTDTSLHNEPTASRENGDTPSSDVSGLKEVARQTRAVVDASESARKSFESRTRTLFALLGALLIAFIAIGAGVLRTLDKASSAAEKAETLAFLVDTLVTEQRETRAVTIEAAEQAKAVADAAPRIEPTPATSASGGKPGKPAGLTLVVPRRLKSPANAHPAPAVSVPIALPSSLPVTTTTGAGP